MIQAAFNTVIYMMLARFMLNDMPHAAGIFDKQRDWVEHGWAMLTESVIPQGIYLNLIAERGLADSSITHSGLQKYKAIMGGYYLLFRGEAPDEAVDTIYGMIKEALLRTRQGFQRTEGMPFDDFVKVLRREEGVPEDRAVLTPPSGAGYLAAMERQLWVESKMKNGTRLDKAIAIDAVMHLEHEEGSYVGWIIGQGIRNIELDYITIEVVRLLSR